MPNKRYWNFRQNIRELLGKRPLGCWAANSPNCFCNGCLPGNTFRCKCCDRLMPYCMGGGVNYTEICDRCWDVADYMHAAIDEPLGVDHGP
jgi:hypothetical protein